MGVWGACYELQTGVGVGKMQRNPINWNWLKCWGINTNTEWKNEKQQHESLLHSQLWQRKEFNEAEKRKQETIFVHNRTCIISM